MLDYKQIGRKIRDARKLRGLSQEQLAEKVWISVTHMSHIETGQTKMSLPVLVDLANALKVSTDELLSSECQVARQTCLSEIHAVLASCTPSQTKILEQIIKAAKAALDENA